MTQPPTADGHRTPYRPSSSSYHQHPTPTYFRSPAASTSSYVASTPPPPTLVLDPAQQQQQQRRRSRPARSPASLSKQRQPGVIVQRLWEGSSSQHLLSLGTTPQREERRPPSCEETAAAFARSAPRAGFLYALGTQSTEYKRRFFVLKPSTHLYVFYTPGDTHPRGCLDLEHAEVLRDAATNAATTQLLPDGRFRFRVQLTAASNLGDGGESNNDNNNNILCFEARSEQVGREWIDSLENERLDTVQRKLGEARRTILDQSQEIDDLEKLLEDYRMVEQDRDGALEDAANWKDRFEKLDEALRVLTQYLRRPPSLADEGEETKEETKQSDEEAVEPEESKKNEAVEPDESKEDNEEAAVNVSIMSSSRGVSLLDDDGVGDGDSAPAYEDDVYKLEVVGTHFSALTNACQQLKESVRLASMEASTAVEDVQAANRDREASESRLAKAEQKLLKLWEENCSVRQELKVTKKEKRALIREIKKFRSSSAANPATGLFTVSAARDDPVVEDDNCSLSVDIPTDTEPDEEGERLVSELEDHVLSSIRLHEQFLASVQRGGCRTEEDPKEEAYERSFPAATPRLETLNDSRFPQQEPAMEQSPRPTKALFDEMEDVSEEEDEEDQEGDALPDESDVSSVVAELGDALELKLEDDGGKQRQNDEEGTGSTSTTTRSSITENGQATARLECPLADVVAIDETESVPSNGDGVVYHLTFYGRKIGIQFQKVPPSTTTGALTEAMSADLPGNQQTASELKRIASFSKQSVASGDDDGSRCSVASPVDAVLVCGFHGFDATTSGNNCLQQRRPKLGARLVAFDGVSVEVGEWTFSSIRKAIQARGRPLTLSFRNDYLTTKQRLILSKAITEVDEMAAAKQRAAAQKESSAMLRHHPSRRRHRRGNSSVSVSSHESGQFVNDYHDGDVKLVTDDDDSSGSNYRYTEFGPPSSIGDRNLRSFSVAGTSSVVSQTFAPLMANLMAGLANKPQHGSRSSTPSYMMPYTGESVENLPDHQEFKAGLL